MIGALKFEKPGIIRLSSLKDAPSPTDLEQLKSVMGCLQSYSRFIPNRVTSAKSLFALQTNELCF